MAKSRPKSGQEEESLLAKKKPPIKSNGIQKADLSLAALNGTSLAFIYGFRQFLPKLFFGLARFILQPINAAANIIRAILSWYEAHKEGYKRAAVLRAVVSTVTGIGIATALIAGLIAGAAIGILWPLLSMISFSVRSLYHFGCAIHYGVSFLESKDPKDKEKAIANVVNGVATAFNAIAIGLVLIALKASFGILGIASGAITAIFALYKALCLPSTAKPPKDDIELDSPKATHSTTRFAKDLGLKRTYSHDDLKLLKNEKPEKKKDGPSLKSSPSQSGLFSTQPSKGPDLGRIFSNKLTRSLSF